MKEETVKTVTDVVKENLVSLDWNSIIKKYFVDLMEVVKGAKDFAAAEIPLYLKELIMYEFWHAVTDAILFAILSYAAYKLGYWFRTKARAVQEEDKRADEDDYGPYWGCAVVSWVLCLIFFCVIAGKIDRAIKVKVAPRLIIVEKIQDLIGSTTKSCGK